MGHVFDENKKGSPQPELPISLRPHRDQSLFRGHDGGKQKEQKERYRQYRPFLLVAQKWKEEGYVWRIVQIEDWRTKKGDTKRHRPFRLRPKLGEGLLNLGIGRDGEKFVATTPILARAHGTLATRIFISFSVKRE